MKQTLMQNRSAEFHSLRTRSHRSDESKKRKEARVTLAVGNGYGFSSSDSLRIGGEILSPLR